MVFWAGIVVAVMLAVFSARRGLYETWAFTFNSVLAIYIGIFAEPYAAAVVPSASDTMFGHMLVVAGITVGAFIVLNGLSFVFVTGQFSVPFPKVLDISVAGLLGFLAGLVIWNFGSFVVFSTPVFPKDLAQSVNYDSRVQEFNIEVFSIPCNAVNMLVASDSGHTTQQAVGAMLKEIEDKGKMKPPPKTSPAKPAGPSKPQQQKRQEPMGPPPEIESQGQGA